MDIPNHDQLLAKIEAFCLRHDLAETRFGRDAINNPNFIRGLRDGVSPTLDTLTKIAAYMARIDEEASNRAKFNAPIVSPPGEEDTQLPFSKAPVNRTGASSPTSSSTSGRRPGRAVNASSRSFAGEAK